MGGSGQQRLAADLELQTCVRQASIPVLADLLYAAYRVGGTSALPTPWRWGYGWAYDPLHGDRVLPAPHAAAAQANVDAYRARPVAPMAFERRVRALADAILAVPGLQRMIDQLGAIARALDE